MFWIASGLWHTIYVNTKYANDDKNSGTAASLTNVVKGVIGGSRYLLVVTVVEMYTIQGVDLEGLKLSIIAVVVVHRWKKRAQWRSRDFRAPPNPVQSQLSPSTFFILQLISPCVLVQNCSQYIQPPRKNIIRKSLRKTQFVYSSPEDKAGSMPPSRSR